MKKEIKGFIAGSVITAVVASGVTFAASNLTTIDVYPNNVTIMANGKSVNSDNFTYNDTTYVPLRAVLELMDCSVDYDTDTNTVYAVNNYQDKTNEIGAHFNGDTEIYQSIVDVSRTTGNVFIDATAFVDYDFDITSDEVGIMFMDNDKYVALHTNSFPKIEYYDGTTIPTYTSVTGINIKDINYYDSGEQYIYESNGYNDSYFTEYMSYITNNGWDLCDVIDDDKYFMTQYVYMNDDMELFSLCNDVSYDQILVNVYHFSGSSSSGSQNSTNETTSQNSAKETTQDLYDSELAQINAKYDAMIETVRSSYSGVTSSVSISAMAQQIQQYKNQRQNEIDALNEKYGY